MTARVLLAGATGVIGRALVPLLRARGHQVTALVREPSRAAGVELDDIVVADALDAGAVRASRRTWSRVARSVGRASPGGAG
ncbi:NAD(P)H-binding protein [Streptomyces hygroscopicus]|uniref:NAD(P)H-binding protein n=1 Tax=Streptomyces hygroscopicus TaxID=1912 RepID=UPI000767062D|nr:NAD(P)H-binding protein [Streptomyces hygroscopicus]